MLCESWHDLGWQIGHSIELIHGKERLLQNGGSRREHKIVSFEVRKCLCSGYFRMLQRDLPCVSSLWWNLEIASRRNKTQNEG